jgi:hypothetical protein
MKLRHLLIAIGASALLAAAACEQQTTNPSGYPGNGPGAPGYGAGVSSGSPSSMSSGSSSGPMR